MENILLTKENNVKVIDFGLSNILQADYKFKTQCGSPSYASPEMLLGKKYDGPAIDVWALGIILFAMVCGYLPFDDEETTKLYKKIIKGNFEIPQHVSPNLADLIQQILVVDPTQRISMQGIFNHRWF